MIYKHMSPRESAPGAFAFSIFRRKGYTSAFGVCGLISENNIYSHPSLQGRAFKTSPVG